MSQISSDHSGRAKPRIGRLGSASKPVLSLHLSTRRRSLPAESQSKRLSRVGATSFPTPERGCGTSDVQRLLGFMASPYSSQEEGEWVRARARRLARRLPLALGVRRSSLSQRRSWAPRGCEECGGSKPGGVAGLGPVEEAPDASYPSASGVGHGQGKYASWPSGLSPRLRQGGKTLICVDGLRRFLVRNTKFGAAPHPEKAWLGRRKGHRKRPDKYRLCL